MTSYAWFNVKMIAFFGLIAFACWWTDSAAPLWALLLMPSFKSDDGDKK